MYWFINVGECLCIAVLFVYWRLVYNPLQQQVTDKCVNGLIIKSEAMRLHNKKHLKSKQNLHQFFAFSIFFYYFE